MSLKTWRLIHKWTSLVCTLVLLLLCLTGLPLIFREEIAVLLGDEVVAPAMPTTTPAATLDRLLETARGHRPRELVRFFFWDHDQPHVVKVGMVPTADAGMDQRR